MNLILDEVDFDTVLPMWSNSLWPGRVSPIRPVSTMMYLGGKNQDIAKKYTDQARFFAIYDGDLNNKLTGVFSGHPTTEVHYRARGLYVLPQYRRQGVGFQLVNAVLNAAFLAHRELCWCIPRLQNQMFFWRCGFATVSMPTTVDMEFGPNIYMSRVLVP